MPKLSYRNQPSTIVIKNSGKRFQIWRAIDHFIYIRYLVTILFLNLKDCVLRQNITAVQFSGLLINMRDT